MKIISWNVNGLRSICKKNFKEWFKKSGADILCLQEIKIQKDQLQKLCFDDTNHLSYFNFGKRKGYAGVAIFAKEKPKSVKQIIGLKRFDDEGRILILEYPQFVLINLYLSHGGRGKEDLGYKLEVYDYLLNFLKKQKNTNIILIGDFNIAHTELDLARPRDNLKNTMFTVEERKKLDDLEKLGFIDTFRCFNGDGGNYTWWPYFANARARNLGWRIDYCFVSNPMAKDLKAAFILKNVPGSDHCPIFCSFDVFSLELLIKLGILDLPLQEREEKMINFWVGVLKRSQITDMFMTPRWRQSKGSGIEYQVAQEKGMTIHDLEAE
ncbi:exodeoxyribonuclease III [Candidatus Daviesbacteria bacterium RIFOXYD1_FULL_41_10]|uniref:Exodeoxyribonuclease III n=1 Tax=Candidatus Daviesbacteria bacterium RIFOXYD1_FULL_41_10 TaxID=1797801 RepID=A0A1F5N118_9BACT|nr:MAG: exodeoxyribonuclease III [Candidatus Daviesbacteria bacterium RIFOXYD1_FULL_41_10]